MSAHVLTIVTFLPLVGVVALFVVGRRVRDDAARWIALAVSLAAFVASLAMWSRFDPGSSGYQLVEEAWWVKSVGLKYLVGIDGISLWLVLLTTFLFPVAILASWSVAKDVRLYMGSMLALETAVLGAFVALDVLLFFLFFEALLVPMYLLIGGWGGERRVYAAIKFFLFTMAGSAFLLVAALVLYGKSGAQLGAGTFDLRSLTQIAGTLSPVTARWLFLGFFVAFAVKVPLFPLHTWLPDAHTEAPTAGSVLLAAVLLKVGTYGLIRFDLTLFPEASRYFATFVSILAVIGIVYGAVCALIQTDVKRLVAYSSVSHLGFVVLGIFAFTQQGLTGGVLQMVNHGLATGGLFLLVGMLYDRTHTRELSRMGGLASVMPWLLGAFLFVVFASIGLPGLNGFVGEFLVVVGTFAVSHWFGSLAVTAVVLSAIYLLWSYQRVAYGPVREEHRHLPDLSGREVAVLAPVLALLLVLGVYPGLATRSIDPASQSVVQLVAPAGRMTDVGQTETAAAGPAPATPPAVSAGTARPRGGING
jgi:NADH-quinone oxidoreductase subunit M